MSTSSSNAPRKPSAAASLNFRKARGCRHDSERLEPDRARATDHAMGPQRPLSRLDRNVDPRQTGQPHTPVSLEGTVLVVDAVREPHSVVTVAAALAIRVPLGEV